MKVEVHRAQSVGANESVELTIEAVTVFPEVDLGEGIRLHERDAEAVVTGLLASLPGGTIDRIVIRLLTDRASRLRVRWPA